MSRSSTRADSPSRAELSPLSFLRRSATVWADRIAVRSGGRRWTYAEHAARVTRLTGALSDLTEPGARVATILPNVPPLLELHYAVPGSGCVLVPLNTRLSLPEYRYILEHSAASLVFADASQRETLEAAIDAPTVWVDPDGGADCEYEAMVEAAQPLDLASPAFEDDLLSINYTSGTTGRPKGVMATHRGAYLHSLGVIPEAEIGPRSSYLWTLPMFHCNGWAYTWAATAVGATHVCLPKVEPEAIWREIAADVTHLCAAPTVLGMILDSATRQAPRRVRVFIGGAPPAPAMLGRAAELGFDITHLYGLTETYGPIGVCAWNPDWDELPGEQRYRLKARQGVATIVGEPIRVVDEEMRDVPADGETIGELAMRGNNVMRGYYRDEEASATAFRGGWFHSGDLGVMHPDGYVEIRDRLKDVVISGGENISTIEVEQALAAHPSIAEAAVIGRPDERWGEVPLAFVRLREGSALEPEALRAFLRERLAGFKLPKGFVAVEALPKTATGKVQKHLLRDGVAEPSA